MKEKDDRARREESIWKEKCHYKRATQVMNGTSFRIKIVEWPLNDDLRLIIRMHSLPDGVQCGELDEVEQTQTTVEPRSSYLSLTVHIACSE